MLELDIAEIFEELTLVSENKNLYPEQIDLFFTTCDKKDNDSSNRVREQILEKIIDLPNSFFEHPNYGKKWRSLKTDWIKVLKSLSYFSFVKDIKIEKKAGRKFNYDFLVQLINKKGQSIEYKVEFKYNSSELNTLPQFIQLYDNFGLTNERYAKFYYETYLDKYLEKSPTTVFDVPSLDEYLKLIQTTEWKKHSFFEQLRDCEGENKKEKNEIVNQSIKDFLEKYGEDLNLELLEKKIRESQEDKFYIMYKDGIFNLDSFDEDDYTDLKVSGITSNSVMIEAKSGTVYKLLLRWKNHNGILNPAWQISVKKANIQI